MSRFSRGVIGLAVLTCLVAASGAPASADGSDDGKGVVHPRADDRDDVVNEWVGEMGSDYVDEQNHLDELKEWILDHDPSGSSGFIEQVNDVKARTATLLWFGQDELLGAALAEARDLSIQVSVEFRDHSPRDVQKASDVLFANADYLESLGFRLASFRGGQVKSSRLIATGALDQGVPASSVERVLRDLTGLEIAVESSGGPVPTATRQSDTSPYYAGALMNDGHEVCSTGFAMITANGKKHTTTARHCQPDGDYHAMSGSGTPGHVIQVSNYGALNVLSGYGSFYAYDGAWNDSSGYSKSVHAVRTTSVGDKVCTGGGNSGEHCNVQITDSSVSFDDHTGASPISTVEGTQQSSGQLAVVGGDSGGPVIVPITSGSFNGEVYAVGMIQAGNYSMPCPSIAVSAPCYSRVYFSYMSTVENHSDLTVATF